MGPIVLRKAFPYRLHSSRSEHYQCVFGSYSLSDSVISDNLRAIPVAVGKPIVAKLADVTSRPVAYTSVLLFYVIGKLFQKCNRLV